MMPVPKSNNATYPFHWLTKQILNIIKQGPMPKHVGFMMDGSRRFARESNIPIIQGQLIARDKMMEMLEWCKYLEIPNVTAYALSIENFKRTKEELHGIMEMMVYKYKWFLENLDELNQYGYCFRIAGNVSLIPERLRTLMDEVYLKTKHNKHFFNIAFAYTSRDEVCRTMQIIASAVKSKEIFKENIDSDFFSRMIVNPQLDIVIRTSGEVRLSDFMLWQCRNASIFFIEIKWPEITLWHFVYCIFKYQSNLKDVCKMEECVERQEE